MANHGKKGFSNDAIPALSACESPIEGKFVQAFFDEIKDNGGKFNGYSECDIAKCMCSFSYGWKEIFLLIQVSPDCISPQRADISIAMFDSLGLASYVCVELDGAQFHATDEQRASDRVKDRKLSKAGYVVLRFSGSEVYNRATDCVKDSIATAKGSLLRLVGMVCAGEPRPKTKKKRAIVMKKGKVV
jgi:hypothetical protein